MLGKRLETTKETIKAVLEIMIYLKCLVEFLLENTLSKLSILKIFLNKCGGRKRKQRV